MAVFGKNQDLIERSRRTADAATMRRRQEVQPKAKAVRGIRPSWVDTYKPSEGKYDLVRLIRNPTTFVSPLEPSDDAGAEVYEETVDWYKYIKHYHATLKRSVNCSGGPQWKNKNASTPCHACAMRFGSWDDVQRKYTSPVGVALEYVLTVLVMELFHKVPQIDAAGNIRGNNKGEPYTDWVQCQGEGCEYCAEGLEMKEGHIQTWPMPKTFFAQLMDLGDKKSNFCLSCAKKTIKWFGNEYECSNCDNPQPASVFDLNFQVCKKKINDKQTLLDFEEVEIAPVPEQYISLLDSLPNMAQKFGPTALDQQSKQFQYTPKPSTQARFINK